MVLDREYMRDPFQSDHTSLGIRQGISGNKLLMFGLVGMYVVQILLVNVFELAVIETFGLVPDEVVHNFFIWQPFTYMFFHPLPEQWGLWILVFNLIGLFFFGPILEARWGRKKYLLFFLAAGVFSALVYVPIGSLFRIASQPVLGAMGPVLGVLVAAAMSRPNMPVLLFFVLPVKMKYMIWLFVGMDVFILLQNGYPSIARTVPHLAGAAFGVIFFLYHLQIDRFLDDLVREKSSADPSRSTPDPRPDPTRTARIDDILDKIHREGINSLTPEERERLEEASEQLNEEDPYDPFKQNPR